MLHKLLPVFLVLFLAGVCTAGTLTLSTDGKTDYAVVLPDAATPVETTAAKELQEHLKQITGAGFAVVKESQADNAKPQILLGNTKKTKELLPELDAAKLPYDGIIRKTAGKNLILTGHPQRGTLYAVYTLLEDEIGVRWWTSTESFIPKKATLTIADQDVKYNPKLIYREAYYKDAINGVFATHIKNNGALLDISPDYGNHHRFQYFVHSFFPILPPGKYFKDHPEWYSEINGQRKHEHAQLCLSNEEMTKEFTKNAVESLKKNPDAGFISVSQNDWHGYCTCKECAKIAEEEGGQSGPLLRFVNKVAEGIEQAFPNRDIWVETLAYQYARKPPKITKPRKNVIIRLCTIECSFVQPLDGPQNKALCDDMEGWAKIAHSLFVWDYTVNFSAYMLPHPNHRVLPANVRFFVNHNTIGLFEQGDSWTTTGDFVRLKTWVLSQLMWNPSQDEKKLTDEFITGYYGADAAPFVKEYWQVLLDRVEKSGVYLGCYQHKTSHWLDAETLVKAAAALTNAMNAAKDETLKKRLWRDMMPVDLAIMQRYHELKRKGLLPENSPFFPNNPLDRVNDWEKRTLEFKTVSYNEGDSGDNLKRIIENYRSLNQPSAPAPDLCKNLPKDSWFEVQSGEFGLTKVGEWTFSVDDAKASNGKAVKMPGSHFEWAASFNFDTSLLDLKPLEKKDGAVPAYRLYAAVRCEAKAADGPAMTLGVYDYKDKKGVGQKTLLVKDINGTDYHWIDMGSIPLKPEQNFWFAPPKRPSEVDAVYIDRAVVVREQ
ncbi:MAG: DUF4838 domain-containing protein [Planctomycetaceae bacterium]|jgi:hypothetical protein|nr:DUF4838 domain-containing protein [Planctomycetaceae bacterium]